MWNYAMPPYDPATGLYKDQSIGDTPKPYTIRVDERSIRVVGVGCKNGGFYVLDARDGQIVARTPVYRGEPQVPPDPPPRRGRWPCRGRSADCRPAAPTRAAPRSTPTAPTAPGWRPA
ncbi:MAG: hypothetical protein U0736_08740 [Gemmataceae bacterium]